MKTIQTVSTMHEEADDLRRAGRRLALVPTMGFLHEGHLELIRVAGQHADTVIMSLFVNPTQFGPNEDFDRYPRDTPGDLKKAQDVGVDIVFMPELEEMYPKNFQTRVSLDRITRYLCGLSRPGHFDGVSTVVAKLFHCTKPDVAVFGQKDFQQLAVIRRMVLDLNMDIQIMGVPTVRESDGLAMSSRNSYLNQEERNSALCLKKSLDLADRMSKNGISDAKKIKDAVRELILKHSYTEIDYVSLCDPATLEEIPTLEDESLLALAVRVGKTRLIDNAIIKKPEAGIYPLSP